MTVLDRVRQGYCALHGHDNLLQMEQERLFLKCVSCDHESPGWQLVRAIRKESSRSGAHQLALVHSRFSGERRVA
jgi:hypothetical protein